MATVQEAPVVSVPLPTTGGLVDVFASHGQSYVRDIQKDLVPRAIAQSGYRWHNAAARNEMIQILRFLTIRKGGVYVHWDALALRSQHLNTNNVRALAGKIAASHAHAARGHQAYVSRMVSKLFQATPDDKKLCFVKEEVFGITDGGPIIGVNHPAMVEMLALPITGVLCCFSWHIVVESADHCAGLAGNFQSKVLFENKGSEALGETTMLQTRMHPSQQKFIDLLGTRKSHTPSICVQSVFIDRDLRGPFALEIFSYWKSSRDF